MRAAIKEPVAPQASSGHIFGAAAVSFMTFMYASERRDRRFILAFTCCRSGLRDPATRDARPGGSRAELTSTLAGGGDRAASTRVDLGRSGGNGARTPPSEVEVHTCHFG